MRQINTIFAVSVAFASHHLLRASEQPYNAPCQAETVQHSAHNRSLGRQEGTDAGTHPIVSSRRFFDRRLRDALPKTNSRRISDLKVAAVQTVKYIVQPAD